MRFLRIRQMMQVTGSSRMTIHRLEIAGQFPRRRQLSGNAVAYGVRYRNLGKRPPRRTAAGPNGWIVGTVLAYPSESSATGGYSEAKTHPARMSR